MVLKTRSCNLLTTPSKSSPRDAMVGVCADKLVLEEAAENPASGRHVTSLLGWLAMYAVGLLHVNSCSWMSTHVLCSSINVGRLCCLIRIRCKCPIHHSSWLAGQRFFLLFAKTPDSRSESYACPRIRPTGRNDVYLALEPPSCCKHHQIHLFMICNHFKN